MNLNPWEVIYIYDQSFDEAAAAIRYWYITVKDIGGNKEKIAVIEWYDKQI